MDNKLIARVRKMEDDFNMVRDIMNDLEVAVYNFEAAQRRVGRLYEYQESGQFLKDFEADERGELPKNMQRGVLSEDALNDLLSDISLMFDRMKALGGDSLPEGFEEAEYSFDEYDPMFNEPESIPEESGSYVVVLREEGEGLMDVYPEPEEFEGQDVLYVGQSDNLRGITDIFKGNSEKSFLRKYIGILNYMDPVNNDGEIRFSTEDERSLGKWMKENLLIYYVVTSDTVQVSKKWIKELDPMLNFEHESNRWADYRRKLKFMLNNCVEEADYKKVNTKKAVIKVSEKDKDLETAIREALADNDSRIPDKFGVGSVTTMISYANRGEDEAIAMIFGGVNDYGEKEQSITVWGFDFKSKKLIEAFLASPEGKYFDGEPEDEDFNYVTKAGDPKLPELLIAILKKHIGVTDKTKLILRTTAQSYGHLK